jgi:hypothetical protein
VNRTYDANIEKINVYKIIIGSSQGQRSAETYV